jgi:MFS transporter, PAT family, solute carrier family 33 (acetyl-CoA transportor), member 1
MQQFGQSANLNVCGISRHTGYVIYLLSASLDIQLLVVMHLFAKLGFAANEAATSLKIVEKGFKREDIAIIVLLDFPFQIAGGWLTAKWSRGEYPLRPWIFAFWPRLGLGLVATLIVYYFPKPPISIGFFVFLTVHTVTSSFAS